MASFADPIDVVARWRPLTSDEQTVAKTLLADATDIIRSRWSDIDARLTSGEVRDATLRRITVGMVKRAMMNGALEGVTQQSQAAGPFNIAQTFANPTGNLYLSADDVAVLDPNPTRGRSATRWLA